MHILIIYSHPSEDSFTYKIKEHFMQSLVNAGHHVEISDLYKMNFNETFTENEYLREAYYREDLPVPDDVLAEQLKINASDIIVFIYPVFWTEAPSKLVSWFQRVWTCGFAYGDNPQMKRLTKALFLVTMGGSLKDTIRQEQVAAMKTVMLGDRIASRAKSADFIVFDEMTKNYMDDEKRNKRMLLFLKQVGELGKNISDNT